MMGNTKEQPETYRGLLANDEYGTRRIKAWMQSIVEPCLEHLGRVFKEVAQKTYTTNKVFRIVQPEAGQSISEAQEKDVEINIPIFNDYGKAIGKWMDYETARFDIRIVAGASMPLNRWALIEEYFRWFQAGLIDDIAMLAETDIRGKKQIAARKSLYSQLSSQLEQVQEALKDKEGTIETLERQLVQAGIKDKIKTAEVETKKDVLQTEAQQRMMRGLMEGEMSNFRKDLRRELDKAKDDNKAE
jgi:membrane-associated HD superfamily phosphohydrolase